MAASVTDGLEGARVGNAKIVTTEVAASNGIIHLIDTVPIPSVQEMRQPAASNPTFRWLSARR